MKLQQLRFINALVRNKPNASAVSSALFTSRPDISHRIRTGRSQLDKALMQENPERGVAFTATDSDVIKTRVRLDMGEGRRCRTSRRRVFRS